jgi:hypothetical protein
VWKNSGRYARRAVPFLAPLSVVWRGILLILMLLLSGCSGAGENPAGARDSADIVIADDVSCPHCQIVLREVALLGSPSDPTSIRENAVGLGCAVGLQTSGEIVVSGVVGGGQLLRYGPDGTLLGVIGRAGRGPGEFGTQLRIWIGAGDTIHVQDDALLRFSVFAPNGEFVRSFRSPSGSRSFARLDGGDWIFFRTPAGKQDPMFHRTSSTGTKVMEFGYSQMQEPDLDSHIVSPAVGGGMWLASVWSYRARRLDASGEPVAAWVRDAPWFPPEGQHSEAMYRTEPPPPFFNHLWEMDDGRLWSYTLVPDPRWEPGLGLRPSPEWYRRTFDTIIEIIDPAERAVVARTRYDGRIGHVCGSHLMYTVIETADGDTRTQVLEPILTTKQLVEQSR